ncbi:MAG: hypothetical protein GY750_18250 [Lentisphaerae bacterium]|nr:hypothetical protein [Lentisphaerota bacterium]MCP4103339.1 hypothetical protein [Lentisphaerota bacterium]
MRSTIFTVITILCILSIIFIISSSDKTAGGKKNLIWTTDPNPQRTGQISGFNEDRSDIELKADPNNSDIMKVIIQSSAGVGPDIYSFTILITICCLAVL